MGVFKNAKGKALERFEKLAAKGTEKEKRALELALLQPNGLKKFHKNFTLPPNRSELEERSVLMVFRDMAEIELMRNIFSIRQSTQQLYITDISLLLTIARNVRDGHLKIVKGKIILTEGFDGTIDAPDPKAIIAEGIEIEEFKRMDALIADAPDPEVVIAVDFENEDEEGEREIPLAPKKKKKKKKKSNLFLNRAKKLHR